MPHMHNYLLNDTAPCFSRIAMGLDFVQHLWNSAHVLQRGAVQRMVNAGYQTAPPASST